MPIKFCSNCGNKITFELQIPEKCPKCDKEINSGLKVTLSTQSDTYQSTNNQQVTNQRNTNRINNQSYNQNVELEESDDINFDLIDQIKASLLRDLRGIDITVDNIPEFRVPIGRIAEEQARNNNVNNQ